MKFAIAVQQLRRFVCGMREDITVSVLCVLSACRHAHVVVCQLFWQSASVLPVAVNVTQCAYP